MIKLTDCYQPAPYTNYEATEGQVLIINLETSQWIALNATGTFLWERLDGRSSFGSIAAELADAYDVDISTTSSDVLVLANDLAAGGYIVPA